MAGITSPMGNPGSPGVSDAAVKFAKIDLAAGAQGTIVTAVTDKIIRVLGGMIIADGAGTVKFQSNDTDLTGTIDVKGSDAIVPIPPCPWGNFETASGEALKATTVTATFDGWIQYQEVEPE